MHSGVHALVTLDLDGNLFTSLQVSAIRSFQALSICPQYISFLASRNELLELAEAIGTDLPSRLFVPGAANLDRDAVHRAVVRPPHRAKDNRRIIGRRLLLGVGSGYGN
jgi:hypothetical protein